MKGVFSMTEKVSTQQMLDDLSAEQEDLSNWERGFIESVNFQLARGKSITELSDKQVSVLEKMYDKYF
jgi:hypothetical protein